MKGIDIFKGRRVGVLAGGPSSEREISIKSGKAVFRAFLEKGLDTVFIDVRESDILGDIAANKVDIAFIALHGRFGEDGKIQEILSASGIPYTGSGPLSSSIAIDKLASKIKFTEAGLLVPGYTRISSREGMFPCLETINVPCVVKPSSGGSSIGLTVVRARDELIPALEKALDQGGDVLAEDFIDGREITVAVLEDRALPVIEIIPSGGVYDYASKYVSSETRYIVPADIGEENYAKAQRTGIAAHQALGCSGFSRTDMRMTPKGEFYVLEVNTIPGLTEKSLLPMAAKADGVDFGELCVKMLHSALKCFCETNSGKKS